MSFTKKPDSLPNLDGFEFIGIDKQYKKRKCYVAKDKNGMHIVKGECSYKDLITWENK